MNYKDKEWLSSQIDSGKSVKDIAKEQGVSEITIYTWKKRLDVKTKKKLHNDRDWLYRKYIEENLTMREIGDLLGVTCDMISLNLKKFSIIKDPASVVSSRRKTMLLRHGAPTPLESKEITKSINQTKLERYGTINTSSIESIIEKAKSTSLDRYGVETFLLTDRARSNLRAANLKSGAELDIFSKSRRYWAKKYDVNSFAIDNFLKANAGAKEEALISFLNSFERSSTDIENLMSSLINIEKYNKFFDLNLFPKLRYKPDFKLSSKIALNVDGLYWHSEKVVDKNYHFNMRLEYENRGLRVIQVRSDEITETPNIVISILNHAMGLTKNKLYARKGKITRVSQKDADIFLKTNHMMGTISSKHIGLSFDGKLVSILSFRITKGTLKVDRFCSIIDYAVVGSFGRLISRLKKTESFDKIHYWADLRYGTGNYLSRFGFKNKGDTLGWKWTDSVSTYNRLRCRANMDDRKLTQRQQADEFKWYKIYDAGQRLWEFSCQG